MNAGANDKTSSGWNWQKDDRGTTGKKAVLWVAAGGLAEGDLGIKFSPGEEEGLVDCGANPSGAGGKGVELKPLGAGEGVHGW